MACTESPSWPAAVETVCTLAEVSSGSMAVSVDCWPASWAIDDRVRAVSVNSPVVASVSESTEVMVERNASISASMCLRRLTCSEFAWSFDDISASLFLGADLQAGLHHGQRFQQASEFVTPLRIRSGR